VTTVYSLPPAARFDLNSGDNVQADGLAIASLRSLVVLARDAKRIPAALERKSAHTAVAQSAHRPTSWLKLRGVAKVTIFASGETGKERVVSYRHDGSLCPSSNLSLAV